MILNVYCFYDTKATMFNTPFFLHTHGEAIRTAIDIGEDLQTRIGRHPEDYIVYCIGTFDTHTAVLSACQPESLGPVASMMRPKAVPGLFDKELAK